MIFNRGTILVLIIFFFLAFGKVSAEDYSFSKASYIHPKIVQDLVGWLSDEGEQIVSINLYDSQGSNRYFGEVEVKIIEGENPFISCREERSFFGYQYIGRTDSGIDILYTSDCGGGSGVFKNLLFIKIEEDMGITFNEKINIIENNRKRMLVKKIGTISLGDRYEGEIKINGSTLLIGKDVGWFSKGSEKDKIVQIEMSEQGER